MIAYIIYLPFTYLITVRVGWLFFRNGATYITDMFPDDPGTAQAVNKLLLTGYYLLNLGYATITLTGWEEVTSWQNLVEVIAHKLGTILMILSLLHYQNLLVIAWISARRNKKSGFSNHTQTKNQTS